MRIAPGIFRLNDIRGIVGDDLTVEAARALGGGYAALMRERGISGAVAIGRDNRPSGAARCARRGPPRRWGGVRGHRRRATTVALLEPAPSASRRRHPDHRLA